LVEQAPNTCVAWWTKDAHCTTLADPVPGNGVSFDVPVKPSSAALNLEKKAVSDGNSLDDLDDVDGEDDERFECGSDCFLLFLGHYCQG
jgi:hypothetical protein